MYDPITLLSALSPEALRRLQGFATPPQAAPMAPPPADASPIAPSVEQLGMQIPGVAQQVAVDPAQVRGASRKSAFMQAAIAALGNLGSRRAPQRQQQGGNLVADRPGGFIA